MSIVAVILLGVVLVAAMAFVVAAYTRRWAWTGFTGSPRGEQPAKTLWDWLQLIGIPLTLAAVAFGLNLAQSGRDQRHEDDRAAAERRLAVDQRREDAVNAYFRQISDLMLDRKLLTSRACRPVLLAGARRPERHRNAL
jgi:type VI protein secretion system component VasK